MAVTKHKSITSKSHIKNSIAYVLRKEKTNPNLVSGINCSPMSIKEQFQLTKDIYDKSDGVIAHHEVQSFSKDDNLTPEQAHKIGIELAEKIAPGFQVLVVTHTDKKQLHNHLIINSVSLETGAKYQDNSAQRNWIQKCSDELCRKNNLSVIEKKKSKGIDQETYQLAAKGQSWKVRLVNAIDEAKEFCNSKDEFIHYLNESGFEVKYQNENISFRAEGQEKFIRTKRLADQFGKEYLKEEIENKLYGRVESKESYRNSETIARNISKTRTTSKPNEISIGESKQDRRKNNNDRNEYEKYIQHQKSKSTVQKTSHLTHAFDDRKQKNDDTFEQQLKISILIIKLIFKAIRKNKMKKVKLRKKVEKGIYRFSLYANNVNDFKKAYCGNLDYEKLVSKEGFEKYITINKEQFEKLENSNVTYGALKDETKNIYAVSVKECDYEQVKEIIKSKEYGNVKYLDLKNSEGQNKYLKLSEGEFDKLKGSDITFSAFKNQNEYSVLIKLDDMEKLMNLISRKFEKQYGNMKYSELNSLDGKTMYKVVSQVQLELLQKTNIGFSGFKKSDGKVNVAFKETDLNRINEILYKKIKSKEVQR